MIAADTVIPTPTGRFWHEAHFDRGTDRECFLRWEPLLDLALKAILLTPETPDKAFLFV